MEKSNKWKYNIKIKHLLKTETTPEIVSNLCTSLVYQLKKIQDQVQKSNLRIDEAAQMHSELETCIDNFEFLDNFATGKIPKEEWDNYSFYGEYEDWFNDYFEQLYDLADCRVITKQNISEKFIWIG